MADPAVIGDAEPIPQSLQGAKRLVRSGREVSRMEEGGERAGAGPRDAAGTRPRNARDGPARRLRVWSRRWRTIEAGTQNSAAAQRSQRRERRGARNPRRHGRRRSHSVRRGNFPHVHPLRGNAALEGGSHFLQRIVRGRAQGSDGAGERRQGLQPAEIRKRRAPRAARAGHRAAGPRPHFGHHRGRAAGSRRSRSQGRTQGHPHRHVLFLGPGRAVGQYHLLRGAHHPPADRPGGFLPGRKIADQESRQGDARAAFPAL